MVTTFLPCIRHIQSALHLRKHVFNAFSFSNQRLFTGDVNDQEVSHMANEELAEYDILTEEFKYVERLIPPTTVPPVPPHNSYPTSSGWMPPTVKPGALPYYVKRTKNHMMPIYEEFRNGNTRKMVRVSKIEGDIWLFNDDLKAFLKDNTNRQIIATQVHELGGYIRVKGLYADLVCKFLLDKGF